MDGTLQSKVTPRFSIDALLRKDSDFGPKNHLSSRSDDYQRSLCNSSSSTLVSPSLCFPWVSSLPSNVRHSQGRPPKSTCSNGTDGKSFNLYPLSDEIIFLLTKLYSGPTARKTFLRLKVRHGID